MHNVPTPHLIQRCALFSCNKEFAAKSRRNRFCCEEHSRENNRMVSRYQQSRLREANNKMIAAHQESAFLLHPMAVAKNSEELDAAFEHAVSSMTGHLEKFRLAKHKAIFEQDYDDAARNYSAAIEKTRYALSVMQMQGVKL